MSTETSAGFRRMIVLTLWSVSGSETILVSDVYEKEPLDPESELWRYDDLVITPHVAGGYHLESAYEAFMDLCIENLTRYKEGRNGNTTGTPRRCQSGGRTAA